MCASADTEELVRCKGISGGLCGLLRPFGEQVQGKVTVRDSAGASNSIEQFGIQFVDFHRDLSTPADRTSGLIHSRAQNRLQSEDWSQVFKRTRDLPQTGTPSILDEVIRRDLDGGLVNGLWRCPRRHFTTYITFKSFWLIGQWPLTKLFFILLHA